MPVPKSEVKVGRVFETASGAVQRRVDAIGGPKPEGMSHHMKRGYEDCGVSYSEVRRSDKRITRQGVTWLSLFSNWGEVEVPDDDVFPGLKSKPQLQHVEC